MNIWPFIGLAILANPFTAKDVKQKIPASSKKDELSFVTNVPKTKIKLVKFIDSNANSFKFLYWIKEYGFFVVFGKHFYSDAIDFLKRKYKNRMIKLGYLTVFNVDNKDIEKIVKKIVYTDIGYFRKNILKTKRIKKFKNWEYI